MCKGLIQIYYGDGKGKTTAALGQAIRCSGRDLKVLFVPFLKTRDSGEFLADLNFDVEFSGYEFGFWDTLTHAEKEAARENSENKIYDLYNKRNMYDMIILDELLDAVELGCLSKEHVISFLNNKPEKLNIVITGHNDDEEIFKFADCITEMKKIKHHYDDGIHAQIGIEK